VKVTLYVEPPPCSTGLLVKLGDPSDCTVCFPPNQSQVTLPPTGIVSIDGFQLPFRELAKKREPTRTKPGLSGGG
jgi:hypothetical protein